uniref:Molybdopterin dehydrogenase n=1 Tax=consortium cosmid clone pGZ1 TaxID=397422 RepID=Q0MX82_9BACT|nr:molybdopterin dehydrogenase [consortium cosmid clone pGZ1]
MNEFELRRADSVEAAVRQVGANPDARFLAGGQSLLPTMKLGLASPSLLVDLARIPGLADIERLDAAAARATPVLQIGAMATHAVVASSHTVRACIPALSDLADRIGDPAVRERGTLGGSLANNDPAACYPAAVLALGATICTDRRAIAADDFFIGLYETALEAGELITAVEFPIPERAGWAKFAQPASRFSLVGVFACRGASGAVRVAVTGASTCVFRSHALESALGVEWSAASCRRVPIEAAGLTSDMHASADYRAQLVRVMAGRAVERAGVDAA